MSDKFNDRFKGICNQYLDVLSKYIIKYEALENDFPVGVMNEIRATFTHIAKMVTCDNPAQQEKELTNAEGHIKRAIRDCYKYNCVSFERRYSLFHSNFVKEQYNAETLIKIEQEHDEAIKYLVLARTKEISGVSSLNPDDVDKQEYNNYIQAISHFETMYDLIHSSKK